MSVKKKKTTKKSVHVLYTGIVYPKVITGGDQLFLDIAPRLPKDINIVVVTPHFAKDYWKNIDTSNISFRFLPPNKFEFKGNPIAIFLSYTIRAFQVFRILKKEDVKTIYSCSDIAYADIWPAYFIRKKKSDIKWLSRVYHLILPPKSRQGNKLVNAVAFRLQRLSFWMMKKRSTTIFALNAKLYKEMQGLDFPNKKLEILGAGIDYKKISSFKAGKKYPYDVVVMGRITPVKGIFDTVKIWSIIHQKYPNIRLGWIGGGSDEFKSQLINKLKESSLENSFELLGYIDKDDAYRVLKSAKIFLCPDHENGWGLAVCEAMSCGLPVVSYDLDIFGGVYKKGYISAPLYNTDEFAAKVLSLLENNTLRKKIANDAKQQVKEFDHQKVVDTLAKYL